jgi:hypothetical protein
MFYICVVNFGWLKFDRFEPTETAAISKFRACLESIDVNKSK